MRAEILASAAKALQEHRGEHGVLVGEIDEAQGQIRVQGLRLLPGADARREIGVFDSRLPEGEPQDGLFVLLSPQTGAIRACYYRGLPLEHGIREDARGEADLSSKDVFFQLKTVTLPEPEAVESLPDSHPEPLSIVLYKEAFERIRAHAEGSPEREVFGLMVGRAFRRASDGHVRVHVTDVYPARPTVSNRVIVEVSAEELAALHSQFEEHLQQQGEANLLKVGWYHTHPGHGVFLSATDRANHRLYSADWHLSLVVDPLQKRLGFFAGPAARNILFALRPEADERFAIPLYETLVWSDLAERQAAPVTAVLHEVAQVLGRVQTVLERYERRGDPDLDER